jgi:hypothetical protein
MQLRERHLCRSRRYAALSADGRSVCYMQMDKFIQSRQGSEGANTIRQVEMSINKLLLHGRTARGKLHNTRTHISLCHVYFESENIDVNFVHDCISGVQKQHFHFERHSSWSDALESTSEAHLYGIFLDALQID